LALTVLAEDLLLSSSQQAARTNSHGADSSLALSLDYTASASPWFEAQQQMLVRFLIEATHLAGAARRESAAVADCQPLPIVDSLQRGDATHDYLPLLDASLVHQP
jgi:hypothetical protein